MLRCFGHSLASNAWQAMNFYGFLLGMLGVWRITHLLAAEDGPGDIVVHLRRKLGSGFWGGLLDCFYCLSIWVAIPFAVMLGVDWRERALLWPALSGGALLLERATASIANAGSSKALSEMEEDREMLRKEKRGLENPTRNASSKHDPSTS